MANEFFLKLKREKTTKKYCLTIEFKYIKEIYQDDNCLKVYIDKEALDKLVKC